MTTQIVVIGRIKHDGTGGAYTSYNYSQYVTANWVNEQAGGGWDAWQDSSDQNTAVVSVDVSNDSNLPGAKDAAENVAGMLATIEMNLEALPSSVPIEWDGEMMTAGKVLSILNTTRFVITDDIQFNNGGVGSADYVNDIDYLYYGSFDGVGSDWASTDEKLMGILLHEMGHLSEEGEDHFLDSVNWYRKEHGPNEDGFYGSDYAENHEKYASNFAKAAASAFGEDLANAYLPEYNGTPAWDPEQIYYLHTRQSPIEPLIDPVIV